MLEKKGKWKCHFAQKEKKGLSSDVRTGGEETLRPKAFFPLFFSPFSQAKGKEGGEYSGIYPPADMFALQEKGVFGREEEGNGIEGVGGEA